MKSNAEYSNIPWIDHFDLDRKQIQPLQSGGVNTAEAATILLFGPLLEHIKPANLVGLPRGRHMKRCLSQFGIT